MWSPTRGETFVRRLICAHRLLKLGPCTVVIAFPWHTVHPRFQVAVRSFTGYGAGRFGHHHQRARTKLAFTHQHPLEFIAGGEDQVATKALRTTNRSSSVAPCSSHLQINPISLSGRPNQNPRVGHDGRIKPISRYVGGPPQDPETERFIQSPVTAKLRWI